MLEKIKENWQQIKESIRNEFDITNVSYKTWIEPLEPYDYEGAVLQVAFTGAGANDDFAINYITKKYTLIFQAMIEEITGIQCSIEFISEPDDNSGKIFRHAEKKTDVLPKALENSNLNPRYTFDTFVVGSNNQFAHAASLSVAESPGQEYNPLFIYGGPGLGKTHLMHSIANFIYNNNPKMKILYVPSEIFTNDLIEGLHYKKNPTEIKNKYRNVDVLLIDDIQFIIGKESTQMEFFNTFNYLYENGKQIIISSDQPPKNFSTLDERLKSRFEWGLTVEISSPDYETRMAILRKKEELDGYTVDNEILQYIATNIRTNIRELEGALTKMYAYSKLHSNSQLTLEIAKENLKDIINPETEKKLTPDHIINVIAEHYGVRAEDIKSQKRNKDIVLPRQVAMYMIRVLNDISLEGVGDILGGRDHSTIIHGYEKIIKEINSNKEFENTIEIIKKKLSQ